jgi:hypothetical protein
VEKVDKEFRWNFFLNRVLFAADADHHRQGGPGMLPLLHQDTEGAHQDPRSVLARLLNLCSL